MASSITTNLTIPPPTTSIVKPQPLHLPQTQPYQLIRSNGKITAVIDVTLFATVYMKPVNSIEEESLIITQYELRFGNDYEFTLTVATEDDAMSAMEDFFWLKSTIKYHEEQGKC